MSLGEWCAHGSQIKPISSVPSSVALNLRAGWVKGSIPTHCEPDVVL